MMNKTNTNTNTNTMNTAISTSRSDVHSPKNVRPEDYNYVGAVYLGSNEDMADYSDPVAFKTLGERGWKDGNFAKKLTCDHCGVHFMYGCVYDHKDGDAICVGWKCAQETFSVNNRRDLEMKRMRKKIAAIRKVRRNEEKAREFIKGHPGLEEALQVDHHIVKDIESKLFQWGSISDKQISLIFKLAEQEKKTEDRKAAEAEELKDVPALREGRYGITGVILHTKWQTNPYGYHSSDGTMKMLVKITEGDMTGNKVWGSMPRKLWDITYDEEQDGARQAEKGDQVTFHAEFSRSKDDDHFGFYKRPTKVALLSEEKEEEKEEKKEEEEVIS